MEYKIPQGEKIDVLDDSNVKESYNIIEKLLGQKLNLDINSEDEIVELLKHPERYIKDQKVSKRIEALRSLILEMSDIYYA